MSVLDKSEGNLIDDTIELVCVIVGTETVQSHTVSIPVYVDYQYHGFILHVFINQQYCQQCSTFYKLLTTFFIILYQVKHYCE